MAYASFEGVGIVGVSAAVPERVIDNLKPPGTTLSDKEVRDIVAKTGVHQRRWAPSAICGSDLCAAAATQLFADMDIDPADIDALIFVSQTPDYRMPATSILLQHRLGLRKGSVAFDVGLGCSGYLYGLFLAYSLINSGAVHRVLLLNGETRTRAYSFRDRATGFLFGDAGTATLIERHAGSGRSHFSLNSDGSRSHLIGMKAGGARFPSTEDTLREQQQPDGGYRSDEQGFMDGVGIFSFMISDVCNDIQKILDHSGRHVDELKHVVLHQASHFGLEHLRRKLCIPADKVPYSLDEFGNTSSASIPLTIVTRLADMLPADTSEVLLSGFGVGLSWGSAVLTLDRPYISSLIELPEPSDV
ncbi:MAG: ketoacyl-ACP synthase III [Gammaproteobacteria bacterium]|nr:ketoacyl-ACP synthase III [Gammaproteobacteria bacterium]